MQLGIFTSTLCGDHKEMGKKSVMHVQIYSFAEETYCFLAFLSGRFSNDDSDGNEIVKLKEKPCRFVFAISLCFLLSGSEWNSQGPRGVRFYGRAEAPL